MPTGKPWLTHGPTLFLIQPPDERATDPAEPTLADLAGLYHAGMRRVVTARLPAPEHAVNRFNRLLVSRGLDPLAVARATWADLTAWQRLLQDREGTDRSRRGIFTRLAQSIAPDKGAGEDGETALAALLAHGAERPGALFPWVPDIDPERCDGCDACLRACPAGALTLVKDEVGQLWYSINAERCTACELCVDLCDKSAISLREMTTQPRPVALEEIICRACGVPVHAPRRAAPAGELCRICRTTDHSKKLFQVLK